MSVEITAEPPLASLKKETMESARELIAELRNMQNETDGRVDHWLTRSAEWADRLKGA